MLKSSLLFMLSTTLIIAQCYGTKDYSNCYDNSGNSYTVTRYGDTTNVQGSSAKGNTWQQTSNTYGDMTITNGTAANGNTWNSTTIDYGGMVSTSGTDSKGNNFSKTTFKPSSGTVIKSVSIR